MVGRSEVYFKEDSLVCFRDSKVVRIEVEWLKERGFGREVWVIMLCEVLGSINVWFLLWLNWRIILGFIMESIIFVVLCCVNL